MSIEIVNVHYWDHPVDFMCDRTSPLGNPFRINKDLNRDGVIEKYNEYFYTNLNPDIAPVGFLECLDDILQAAKTRDITLGCWCAPKRCHCEVIKDYIDREVKEWAR
jgi:hypothetical protein